MWGSDFSQRPAPIETDEAYRCHGCTAPVVIVSAMADRSADIRAQCSQRLCTSCWRLSKELALGCLNK